MERDDIYLLVLTSVLLIIKDDNNKFNRQYLSIRSKRQINVIDRTNKLDKSISEPSFKIFKLMDTIINTKINARLFFQSSDKTQESSPRNS